VTDIVNMFIGVRILCRKDLTGDEQLTVLGCLHVNTESRSNLWLLLTLMAACGSSWWETVLSLFRVSHGQLEAPLPLSVFL